MTSQFLPAKVERQREVGLWVVSLLHCLNSILHQLVDFMMIIDQQSWMKLSSLHQVF